MFELVIGDTIVREGQHYVADIGLGKEWVTYSSSNDGEENHYRDVFENGELAYCYGEVCRVSYIDKGRKEITLKNVGEDIRFTISIIQFMEDFIN